MGKKKLYKIVIFFQCIIIAILLLLISIKLYNHNWVVTDEKIDYLIDIKADMFSSYKLENGKIVIYNFAVYEDNEWYLEFMVENNSRFDYNLREKYSLIMYDKDEKIIEVISNGALGDIPQKSTIRNLLKLEFDGSLISKIEFVSN